jgi:hypothetical protein
MDPEELVSCYQASNPMEAQFIVDQLAEFGVLATCDELDMQNQLGPWDGNPHVYVKAYDLDRARQWLEDYDKRQAERAHHAPGSEGAEPPFEWSAQDIAEAEQAGDPEA